MPATNTKISSISISPVSLAQLRPDDGKYYSTGTGADCRARRSRDKPPRSTASGCTRDRLLNKGAAAECYRQDHSNDEAKPHQHFPVGKVLAAIF
jgi:hypothetical protein